jgi:hypothetical protein
VIFPEKREKTNFWMKIDGTSLRSPPKNPTSLRKEEKE